MSTEIMRGHQVFLSGRVIATGAPEELAKGRTPIAPYLQEVLEG